jgi:hypothetical protein
MSRPPEAGSSTAAVVAPRVDPLLLVPFGELHEASANKEIVATTKQPPVLVIGVFIFLAIRKKREHLFDRYESGGSVVSFQFYPMGFGVAPNDAVNLRNLARKYGDERLPSRGSIFV